jgi:hypothetical protein
MIQPYMLLNGQFHFFYMVKFNEVYSLRNKKFRIFWNFFESSVFSYIKKHVCIITYEFQNKLQKKEIIDFIKNVILLFLSVEYCYYYEGWSVRLGCY